MLGSLVLHSTNPIAVRETGSLLLAWAALAGAAGRAELAVCALADGIALLEHAAALARQQPRLQPRHRP
jgi:hypothetical protein